MGEKGTCEKIKNFETTRPIIFVKIDQFREIRQTNQMPILIFFDFLKKILG